MYIKSDMFNFYFFAKVTCAFLLQELSELNPFKHRKTTISSPLMVCNRLEGYRCELDIAIFAFRIS